MQNLEHRAGATDVLPLNECRVIGILNGPELFGHERANITVFESLRSCGAEVTVGVTQFANESSTIRAVERLGFETFRMPFGSQWSKRIFLQQPAWLLKNAARVFRCSRVLGQQISRLRATHIHIGNPLVYSYIAPLLFSRPEIQLVYRMGDEPPVGLNRLIWRACLTRADRVVANSEFVRQSIRSACRTRTDIQLIYNTVSEAGGSPANTKEGKIPFRVLYVGQISRHKGILEFVNAAITLCKRNYDCCFDIVGGSRYTLKMERLISEQIFNSGFSSRIRMHGHVDDPGGYYRDATLLVVPSLFEEPAANVVLEAKAYGVPAIVFPSGGLPELIVEGVTGWVCKYKSEVALVEQLERCLADPDSCHKMSGNCVEEAIERFGSDRFARLWSMIYHNAEFALTSSGQGRQAA
ncbi:MAG: glycosyltransferase family 4 protein [Planctomycetaceae bacterium]|nr:glycosyltransferase family 4 protein [Planctomycetaceae bacterium]MCA9083675.1 glycosyltransferase family 4 protein [Planctomycetaceae bacterium]